jgi:hypothetical protein
MWPSLASHKIASELQFHNRHNHGVPLKYFDYCKHRRGATGVLEIDDGALHLRIVSPARSESLYLGQKDIKYSKADPVSLFRSRPSLSGGIWGSLRRWDQRR